MEQLQKLFTDLTFESINEKYFILCDLLQVFIIHNTSFPSVSVPALKFQEFQYVGFSYQLSRRHTS